MRNKFYDVVSTTTGNIELETDIAGGGGRGTFGDLNRNAAAAMIKWRENKIKEIRRFVAEHAKSN